MLYLVRGCAQQLFSAFGASELVSRVEVADMITQDLLRTPFLGTEIQANQHVTLWKQVAVAPSYAQGNMSAGILQYLFGANPLKKEKEDVEEYKRHYAAEHFAYLDEANASCGLIVMYRRDNPAQWMLGFIRNTHLAPKDRKVILLSSFDLAAKIKNPEVGVVVNSDPMIENQLLEQLGFPVVHDLVNNIINRSNNEINQRVVRIQLLMRFLQVNKNDAILRNPIDFSEFKFAPLFADNPALDLLLKYHIHRDVHLSFALLKDCISENSSLRKEIEGIKFGDDEGINQRLLRMMVVFYEEKKLEENRDLLADHEFINRFRGCMWDKVQIKLLSFMRKKQYDERLMQFILADEAYYHCVSILEQLGLTQDVPLLFANPQKQAELQLINTITDEDCRQLCLIFWAKDSLTENDYKEIIAVAKEYPLMAAALVDMNKQGIVIGGINGLRELILTPKDHLKLAIKHHFFKEPAQASDIKGIKKLSLMELKAASTALGVLRSVHIVVPEHYKPEHYKKVVAQNKEGRALRIFLPQLADVRPLAQQQALIDILYEGVNSGIPEQGNKVLAIKDKQQRALAKDLRARFICVRQMQDLGFSEEIIFWSAQEHNNRAQCFRKLILQIEAQYKSISEQMPKSDTFEKMRQGWDVNEAGYRKELYRIAYDALISPKETAEINLKTAKKNIRSLEKKILAIIDPPHNSKLYKTLILIANIAISILTVGIANYIKERYTGNPWFFTQSRQGEELRALTKNVIKLIHFEDEESTDSPQI